MPQDRVPLEDVRRAARTVVNYLIEDEEEFYAQNRQDDEGPHEVLACLRLLDRWLAEAPRAES